jgi:hypothetical protein
MLLSSTGFPPTYLSVKTQQRLANSGVANGGFQVFTVFYLYPLLSTVLFGVVYHRLLFHGGRSSKFSGGKNATQTNFTA